MLQKYLANIFILAMLLTAAFHSSAQTEMNVSELPKEKATQKHQMNFVKTNLTSILLKNYSLQYERILNRKFSIAVQYRMMPVTTMPFQKLILDQVGNDDPDTKKVIQDFRMSNYAITPEVRFYVGKKGYGRGFYLAPFYRYASFTSNKMNIFYTDDNDNESSILLSGKLTSNTGGLLLGIQHFIGKHIVYDVWLLGPHYGSGKGNFNGVSSKTLSNSEQNSLREKLNNLDIPLTNKTIQVDANSASLKLDGPWGGMRGGISLGVKF